MRANTPTAEETLAAIAAWMNSASWDAEVLDGIADALRAYGFVIGDGDGDAAAPVPAAPSRDLSAFR